MKRIIIALVFASIVAMTPSSAHAISGGLELSIGEGIYFINGDVYRGPVSLELVGSLGWEWFKFDLGLYGTLEDLAAMNRNFVLRPGARITPPKIPIFFRMAIPIQVTNDFDWGILFGFGGVIPLIPHLGILLEVDTWLTKNFSWGADGIPLEFRAGLAFSF